MATEALQSLLAENGPPPSPEVKPQAPLTPIPPSAPNANSAPTDDLSGAYLQHRTSLEGRAALSTLMSENAPTAQPKPDSDVSRGTSEASGDRESGRTLSDLITGRQPQPSLMSRVVSGVGSVAKDVGLGLVESGRAGLAQGARDAVQSMLDGVHSLAQWVDKKTDTGDLLIDKTGIHWKTADEMQNVKPVQLPSFGEPTTVTGNVIKSASQFVTSMALLSKAFGPMGTEAEGAMGKLATGVKSGGAIYAGFEKADGNLADLVQQVPRLRNPVTAFLQSQPDDSEAAGRLRNAIAGVGFGELQEGILKGLSALRGVITASPHLGNLPETAVPAAEQGAPTPEAFKFLGDANAPATEPLADIRQAPEGYKATQAAMATEGLTPEAVQAMGAPAAPGEEAGPRVPGATEAQAKEPEVYINFARIDTPDDVKRTMSQLADAQKGNIDAAQRGVKTFEATKLGADFTDAWKTLMDRRIGEPLNAEEQLAGRQLLAQSAMKTEQLTTMALANPQDVETLFAWRKQMQTHAMIQAEVSGSQAEIARSLGAMRIPVAGQGAVDRMGAITNQLDQMGGVKSNLDFLMATKSLMDAGRLEDLGNVAEKSMYARTRDGLITAWTNGLLTNPLTHVKVNLSNIGTIAVRLAETRFAETMDRVTDFKGVPAGEAAQTTAGLISGIKDSFRYLGKLAGLTEAPATSPLQDAGAAFKSGHYTVGTQEPDWAQKGQESSNALAIADSGWVGKATDMLSSVVTSPGRALAGEHEFYRSIGMRMELNRFAYRQATDELNAGKIDAKEFAGRVSQLIEEQPKNITTQAVDGMTYQTFTDAPGKLAQIIENLRTEFPLTRVIIPFYKIPARIMSFTFERSPLAPLMEGWRADIAAGGARQSMALAKTGLGSMVMLAASDAVLNGQITGGGPKDRGQRQTLSDTGWLPYSVKTPGGRWVQYNRLETVGSSMAMAADMTEAIRDYYTAVNKDDPNVEKLTAAGIATLANNVTSKTYFEGVARFFETISDPRSNAESMLKSLAGSVVPAGAGAVARLMDPYTRATYSMIDAIKANTPGVSKDLPPLRNLWGEPVRHDSGLGKPYDAFVPFATRRAGNEPIDKEIMEQGMHFTLPASKTSFGGAVVDLAHDPQTYSRYVELAGNELKSPAWGMGQKDLMNAIVSGDHALSPLYNMKSDGPDGGKALMLRGIREQYQRDARDQLLHENEPLRAQVKEAQDRHAALKMIASSPK